MTGTIAYMAAQEHTNDLRRAADRYRVSAEVRPPRRIRFALPRFLTRDRGRPVTARNVLNSGC